MINYFNIKIQLVSKTAKGQVFFRRLLNRQQVIINAFQATSKFPRVL